MKKRPLVSTLAAGALALLTAVHVHAKEVPPCPDVYDPVCGVDGNTYPNAGCAPVEIACEGECPCPQTVTPRIEIGPRQVVILDQVGDTFQFTATWVDWPYPLEPLVLWESSNPEQVSVSAGGLATALVDDAFAVMTATTAMDVVHEPGFASVMIAELQEDLRLLPEDLVTDFSVLPVNTLSGPTGETKILATVTLTPATAGLRQGDVVVFGDLLGIRINRVTADPAQPRLHLEGRGARLDEIYSELEVDLGQDGLELIAEAGARAVEARTKASPCVFQLQPIIESGSHFKIQMNRGELILLSYLVEGEMGFFMPSVGVRTRVVCSFELGKLPIWTPIPLLGLSIVPYLYTAAGGHLFVDTTREYEVETPSASVSTSFFGGLHFEDGELTYPSELSEPDPTFDLRSLLFDFSDVDISVSGSVFIDAGVRLTLYPGTVILDDFALAHGTFLVSRIEAGREYHLPWQAHLGPEHPDYEGPTAEDFYAWIVWPMKELGTGGTINFFLELLGIGAVSFQPPGLDVLRNEFFHPRPILSVDPDVVFVNGSPSAASLQTTLTPWQNPLRPNPIDRVEVWHRRLPDGELSRLFTGTDGVYAPGPADAGAHQFRSMAFNRTFGVLMDHFPVASGPRPLSVEVAAVELEIEPGSLSFSMSVGDSETRDVTLTNRLTEPLDWFVANTGGLDPSPLEGTLAPGEAAVVQVKATCGSAGTTETLVTFQAGAASRPDPIFRDLAVTLECDEVAAAGWPSRLHDAAATGFTPDAEGLQPPLELDYRIDPPAGYYSPELVAPVALDGRAYTVFARNDSTQSRVDARSLADGSVVWTVDLPGYPLDANPMVSDGILLVPIDRDWNDGGDPNLLTERLYALSSENGGQLWQFAFERQPFADDAGLQMTADETTVFALVSYDNFPDQTIRVHALDKATGQLLWMTEQEGGSLFGNPTLVGDVVAFSWGDGTAGFDTESGERLWISELTVSTWSWDLTGNAATGLVYLPSHDSTNGMEILDARTGFVVGSFAGYDNGLGLTNPVLAAGDLYQIAGWFPAEILRFDAATGALESRLEIPTVNGDYTFMSLAGGVLYTTTNQFSGHPLVRAIDPSTGAVLWESAEEDYSTAPLVVAGGKLLVTNAFGISVYTSASN